MKDQSINVIVDNIPTILDTLPKLEAHLAEMKVLPEAVGRKRDLVMEAQELIRNKRRMDRGEKLPEPSLTDLSKLFSV